ARRIGRAEVDGRADGDGAHVPSLLDGAPGDLLGLVGVGQELVVVELYDERNAVRVLAGHRAEHAEGAGDGVATAFDRQLHDVLRIEVQRVLREGRAGGVLDALVHGQDRQVSRLRQTAVVEQRLQAA